MYRIILKLLLIKGYNNETIQATLVQHNPPDPAGFLNNYLDNEERTIAHKLGTLCVDDATFIQWTDYVKQCKDAGYTNTQILEVLEPYAPTKQLIEEANGSLSIGKEEATQEGIPVQEETTPAQETIPVQESIQEATPVYQLLQGEETVAVKEVVQEIVDSKSLDSYNFDYADKKELDNEIRNTQTLIADNVYKLSLLKDKTKQGPYINESYLDCPSYKKMIPQIQNVIVEKRKMSINKFWYEKYRPELVEEIVFPNEVIKETIHDYVDNRFIKGHCMFFGQGGVGKTTTNIVLMNAVLESVKDRFVLERKVQDIEDLKGWLRASPIGRQKIVIAEEFDRLSDAAQTEIKNGLMEKYDNVVFLASTNKLHKIDGALLSRFTLVAKFDVAPVEELAKKCSTILSSERISYKMEDVTRFAEANKLKGLRTIINNLQLSCYNNIFDADRTSFFIGNSGAEFDVLQNIKWYIQAVVALDKNALYQLSYNLNFIPDIAKVRQNITYILQSNYSLNLEYIYTELLNEQIYLPIKNLITDYYQDSDLKKIPSMHFEAMLNDIIMETLKSKDIFNA